MAIIRRKISISVTNKEYLCIRESADKEGVTMNDYILNKLGIVRKGIKLTLREVVRRIPSQSKIEFSLPQLFPKEEWEGYSRGSRAAVGREFYRFILKSGKEVEVEFFKRASSNLAIYRTL